jgi:alcohol dehydrogenase class IV
MANQVGKFVTTQVIHHGPGALAQLDREIARLGGGPVGLLTDRGVVQAKLHEQVLASLRATAFTFDQISAEPSYEVADQCVAFLRERGCVVVIALGGGSVIDTAKMAAVLVVNGGRVPDYWGPDRVPKAGLPVIAIPTTAGTGSEVSPASVFIDPGDQAKKGVRSDAILDPTLTLSLPQGLTASTGIDALTHAIECYTALATTLIGDLAAERAIELIGRHLPVAYANGKDLEARTGMLMGSLLAGMALAVANTGACHALAQSVGGMISVAHGVGNALFLPYVMEFNRLACREKYARVAALLGEPVAGLSLDEASGRAVSAVRRLTQELRLPQRLREVGVREEQLQTLAQRCLETQFRLVANNPRTLSLEEAEEILRKAY